MSELDAGGSRAAPAQVFAALGDGTRLTLLEKLSDGRRLSITDLSLGAGLTRQAVTKHLKVMENAGLLSSARTGRESRYALRRDSIQQARVYLEHVSSQWDAALAKLQGYL